MDCYVKKTLVDGDTLVAVCDKEILGKKLEQGKLRLYVDKSFYGGVLLSIEDALEEIKGSSIANIVGNRIISKAIKDGIVHELGIIKISGIAHAQIIKV